MSYEGWSMTIPPPRPDECITGLAEAYTAAISACYQKHSDRWWYYVIWRKSPNPDIFSATGTLLTEHYTNPSTGYDSYHYKRYFELSPLRLEEWVWTDNECAKEELNSPNPDTGKKPCVDQAPIGSSVNVTNGNLYDEYQISPSSKFPIALSFNSRSNRESLFGYGWNADFDIRLLINSAGSAVLIDFDGREEMYKANGDGTFVTPAGTYDSLSKTNAGYQLQRKNGNLVTFDSNGKPVTITDPNGNQTTYGYGNQQLTEIMEPDNTVLSFTRDQKGRITAISEGAGRTTSFTYDTGGNLTSITDPVRQVRTFAYDTGHHLLTKTDPVGNTTRYSYDSNDRLLGSVDAAGNTRSVAYASSSVTTVTDPAGNATEYDYNQDHYVTEKKDALGNVVDYTWDQDFNMTSVADASGTVGFTYDGKGDVLSRTDQQGETTSYTYDQAGDILTVTAPDGSVTAYGYDARSNLVAVTDPTGLTTRYAYDGKGRLTAVADASGRTTAFAYDAAGNLVRITDPAGAVMTLAYDAAGNMISATDPAGVRTAFAYDVLNRLVQVTDAAGSRTDYQYDALGNRTGVTDANGNATGLEYDFKGRVTRIIDALGQATRIAYSEAGCPSCGAAEGDKPASLTDANGNITFFSYDAVGRLVAETDPLGNVTQYGYDAKGNVISRTDAEGRTVVYTYDQLGRLTGKTYPDGSTAAFAYDVKGRLIQAANQYIAYAMAYDAADRLVAIIDSNSRTVLYEYDAAGNRVKMTTPEGRKVAYSYDADNRLVRIDSWAGAFTFGYDLPGRRTSLAYPNGVVTSYAYDPLGNLTEILTKGGRAKKSDILSAFTYTHDKIGNRLSKIISEGVGLGHGSGHDQAERFEYTYDHVYRLTDSLAFREGHGRENELRHLSETFVYDPVGNRITGPKEKYAFTYNQDNQLLQGPKYSYQYDRNGNLTGKIGFDEDGKYVSWSYEYDYENRLIRVTRMDAGETKVVSFKYDPFGRRIEKKVEELEGKDRDSVVTTYVYDNEDVILAVRSGFEGDGDREYESRDKKREQPADRHQHEEVTRYLHGPGIDEPLAIEQKGALSFYQADGLGSITTLTDTNGRVVQSYDYSSFGIPKHLGDHVKQPYTYTGREWDSETGLYFYRARYYDPVAGRFIAKDPIGFAGGDVNLYAMTRNNPVNLVDPSGKLTGIGDFFAWGGIKTAEYAVKGISYLAGQPMTDEQFQKMDESLMGAWKETTTATPYAVGAGVALVTGDSDAGISAATITGAIINGIAGQPIGDPYLGIEWINPSSLNESEPCH